ncbi:MAG: hypothetical protein UT84_C0004G0017 [Candidatus Curtissbacteria bacterium GW2011_GWA1_40_16]|uniref:Polymerase nucleotidyl transferase domain-containing protein n=1 Tax=Candidatus Curtissbacteria bacterium GW2011_GWA1_40_16 TaxID=1618405 RepID=A0A0G0RE04_9BACT|nr:MAG: hypothetical protein UT84_C0004G0017 [Candidatus Curtissbacteria bacterium GW2011_GWA1_40_16]
MNLKQSILATLVYHDIFNYPLTESEIYSYLTGSKSSLAQVKKGIEQLIGEKRIGKNQEFYFLNRRKDLPLIRLKRQKFSRAKLKRAAFYATILKLIPSIELVAISGGLSMGNSTKNDDIDLVIITSRNKLWQTRFFANLILLPYKRSPHSKIQKDKACLNIFLDKKALKITGENLYTAHEICQMKPIWDRNNTYQKFLRSNKWTKRYLPNWEPGYQSRAAKSRSDKSAVLSINLSKVESLAKSLQLKYMSSKITNEKIGDSQLFFHPKETQKKVLAKYKYLISKQS